MKPKLLWVGDAVCHTGFARVTHNVIPYLQEKGWEVAVLGVGYYGDPHDHDYLIYPARRGASGNLWGVDRLPFIMEKFKPDVILVNNDPWNVIRFAGKTEVPLVSYMPIDAPNVRGDIAQRLSSLAYNIAYTRFGMEELRTGGVTGKIAVVPHGVDTDIYRPMDKSEARSGLNLPKHYYTVGNVNRNQPRKRLDLTIMCFAKWVCDFNLPKHVMLHLHCGLDDVGWDIVQLCQYFGIVDRLIITDKKMQYSLGVNENVMPYVYNSFDVQISTTLGEGWGLTTHEGMACGVPQIVPDWSALAEWPREAVRYIPIRSWEVATGTINTVGGVIDEEAMVKALQQFYKNDDLRKEYGVLALERATETRFSWASVANGIHSVLSEIASNDKKWVLTPTSKAKSLASGSSGALETVLKGAN